MTIALGFLCPDGVVIGADRRISGQALTFAESKILPFGWGNGKAVIGYSGNRDTWVLLQEQIGKTFPKSLSVDADGLRSRLKLALRSSVGKKEAFCTLCGYWIDESGYGLVKTDGDSIVPVPSSEVIGWGNSALSRYLIHQYESTLFYTSVRQAIIYAVNFISQAERFDGQYIGNGMEVYSLQRIAGLGPTSEGRVGIKVLPPSGAEEYQRKIDEMNHWMGVLFGQMTDRERPLNLDQFIGAIERFRLWTSDSVDFTLSGFQR